MVHYQTQFVVAAAVDLTLNWAVPLRLLEWTTAMVLTFVGLVDIVAVDVTRLIDLKYKNFVYRSDDYYAQNGEFAAVDVNIAVDLWAMKHFDD